VKIAIFWKYYDAYVRSFYERYPHAASQPYALQLDTLLDDCFNWPSSVARRLRDAGHDVQFIIANAQPLQRAWANEHGIAFPPDWPFSLPLRQVEAGRPDVLWINSAYQYFGEYLHKLKPLTRKLFGWIAAAVPPGLDLSPFDCILTSHPNIAEGFRRQSVPAEILLPAFEPKVLDHLGSATQDIEVSFIGGLTRDHSQREEVLKTLCQQTPIQLWGYGFGPGPVTGVRSFLRRARFALFPDRELGRRYRGQAWGLDMYRLLQRSRMTVNIHVDVAGGLAGNIRMFEATGMGTLLLNERAANLQTMFEPESEVVTYGSTDELAEKIQYYLAHDAERQQIAATGQRRTRKDHTTARRSQELLSIFEGHAG